MFLFLFDAQPNLSWICMRRCNDLTLLFAGPLHTMLSSAMCHGCIPHFGVQCLVMQFISSISGVQIRLMHSLSYNVRFTLVFR